MSINLTLVGQMITFMLFVWFTQRFVWPPLMKALDQRQAKIADGLAAAEKGQRELVIAQEKSAAVLQETKEQAAHLLAGAKKQAEGLIEKARTEAQQEGVRLMHQAEAEIAKMVEEAKESLRQEVAKVALLGAEKILGRTIQLSDHHAMLENLTKEIG